MKISRLSLIFLLFGFAEGVGAQSLWNPGFTGYLSGKISLQVGDLVSVSIETNTKLSYTSSNVSDRTLTLEFSGSSGGNPLSFLPQGTSGEKSSLKGGEDISLSTKLVARVQSLDQGGHAFLQGSRTLEVNGRQEMVTVSGWMDPSMMADGRQIGFSDLADSKLVFSSTLMQNQPVLTAADIAQVLAQAAPPASPAVPGATAPVTVGTPATAAAPANGAQPSASAAAGSLSSTAAGQTTSPGTLQLSDAKKRALLLDYLNKMLDLIFAKGSP
jgi:flagellar basal body L-ring protein FlgH